MAGTYIMPAHAMWKQGGNLGPFVLSLHMDGPCGRIQKLCRIMDDNDEVDSTKGSKRIASRTKLRCLQWAIDL